MDLIDRQEAIKALEKAGEVNYIATGDFHGIINALNVIKALPTAERKTGRWVGNPETCEFMICSVCGHEFDWYSEGGVSSFDWNYCPHCGAFMGGDTDGDMPN